ncbi:MAG: hypothetical protein J7K87_03005 [Candidatus Aenigmarchaeota archaeon]|nr:hypothetical protein [Candidatus Aenigmarchaeota archaeon]
MVENPNILRVYTMRCDTGFAPCVKDNWISIACCAPPVRQYATEDDYVLGISGRLMEKRKGVGIPYHTPIFLMKVTERLTFDEYFHDERFKGRVDNIYKKNEKGKYVQTRFHVKDERYIAVHEGDDDWRESEYVLVSNDFYYFGNFWKKDSFLTMWGRELCKKIDFSYVAGGNAKHVSLDKDIAERIITIRKRYKKGKLGDPNDILKLTDSFTNDCKP